ncbi:hypothetical protein DFH09DRAFT_444970 [Mycena vulgaris]|nr:hypothetical protein DFH09DRAFT_444970 [Mycena vulgaris]
MLPASRSPARACQTRSTSECTQQHICIILAIATSITGAGYWLPTQGQRAHLPRTLLKPFLRGGFHLANHPSTCGKPQVGRRFFAIFRLSLESPRERAVRASRCDFYVISAPHLQVSQCSQHSSGRLIRQHLEPSRTSPRVVPPNLCLELGSPPHSVHTFSVLCTPSYVTAFVRGLRTVFEDHVYS